MRKAALLVLLALGCSGVDTGDPSATQAESDALKKKPPLAPAISLDRVTPLQPGWLRLKLDYAGAAHPSFEVTPTCRREIAGQRQLIVTTAFVDAKLQHAFVDLKVDYHTVWAYSTSPCQITTLRLVLLDAGVEVAARDLSVSIESEFDLPHTTPAIARDTFGDLTGTEVDLGAPRRYAAYPPHVIAITSAASGQVALAEVEVLPARGTLGLRWLSRYNLSSSLTDFEIGGGAELEPGFGIDIDVRGVTKPTVGLEHSNPGHATFDTPPWEPSFLADATQQVFPYPPRYPLSLYHLQVLDNRGLDRVLEPQDAIDVIWDADQNKLLAVNGSSIKLLEHQPLSDTLSYPISVPRPLLRAALASGPNASPEQLRSLMASHLAQSGQSGLVTLPTGKAALRNYFAPLATQPLAASASEHEPVQQAPRRPSPQELSIIAGQDFFLPIGPLPNDPGDQGNPNDPQNPSPAPQNTTQRSQVAALDADPIGDLGTPPIIVLDPSVDYPKAPAPAPEVDAPGKCVLSADNTKLEGPLSECKGYDKNDCPKVYDHLPLQELRRFPGTPRQVSVIPILTPLRAGRVNTMGTCGTHAEIQAFEAALNLEYDDLAPQRAVIVDGLPVGIPEPRVALSTMANLADQYSKIGTRADPVKFPFISELTLPSAPAPWYLEQPQFTEGIWPARENLMPAWAAHFAGHSITRDPWLSLWRCSAGGFWIGGFCSGQGTAPPGVYSSYSRMALDLELDRLRDGIFSQANSYNSFTTRTISLADKDAAILEIIATLRAGLPVRIDYATALVPKEDVTPKPIKLRLFDTLTWSLPRELSTCDFKNYYLTGGHAANLVAVVLRGPSAKPDPFRSFFIIENNWGRKGDRGFNAITFAAFKLLTGHVQTFHLDRDCASYACR